MTTDVLVRRFKQTTNRQLTGGCVDFLTGDHTVVVAVGGGLGRAGGGLQVNSERIETNRSQQLTSSGWFALWLGGSLAAVMVKGYLHK